MLNNAVFIFVILFMVGCIGKAPVLDQKDKLSLSVVQNLIDADSTKIFINAELPNRVAVFKKKENQFVAEIQIMLTILDLKTNNQVYRKSWKKIITETYYENTRSKTSNVKINEIVNIIQGNYRIFVKIEDLDSHLSWNATKEIHKKDYKVLSSITPVKSSHGDFKPIIERFNLQTDTLFLQCQVFDSTYSNEKMIIKTFYDDELIDSITYHLSNNPPFHIYNLPIHPRNESFQKLQFSVCYKNQIREVSVPLKGVLSKYWSYDLNEVVAVMNYILTTEEVKLLNKLDMVDKEKFIDMYWTAKNPNPEQEFNPVLNEFNKRVKYANTKFSIAGKGWRTDMGRIYIKYGPPLNVENQFNDREGYRLQIWHYNLGKQFIFIDRGLFGHYELYREIN